MIEDLFETCSTPDKLPLFNVHGPADPFAFVNGLRSTQEWASLQIELYGDVFKIGWNGKRLSWTDDTKRFYGLHTDFHNRLVKRLSGMTPTDVVLRGLENYAKQVDAHD